MQDDVDGILQKRDLDPVRPSCGPLKISSTELLAKGGHVIVHSIWVSRQLDFTM